MSGRFAAGLRRARTGRSWAGTATISTTATTTKTATSERSALRVAAAQLGLCAVAAAAARDELSSAVRRFVSTPQPALLHTHSHTHSRAHMHQHTHARPSYRRWRVRAHGVALTHIQATANCYDKNTLLTTRDFLPRRVGRDDTKTESAIPHTHTLRWVRRFGSGLRRYSDDDDDVKETIMYKLKCVCVCVLLFV